MHTYTTEPAITRSRADRPNASVPDINDEDICSFARCTRLAVCVCRRCENVVCLRHRNNLCVNCTNREYRIINEQKAAQKKYKAECVKYKKQYPVRNFIRDVVIAIDAVLFDPIHSLIAIPLILLIVFCITRFMQYVSRQL